jgi:hypothetical protein
MVFHKLLLLKKNSADLIDDGLVLLSTTPNSLELSIPGKSKAREQ